MVQSRSAAHAKAYFNDALVKADYYLGSQDQEHKGQLQGKLAERLGLAGPITKERFFGLCENVNPATGKPLTPLTRDDRTVGYDVNFHCPKSVSVIHALSNDDHILDIFQDAVRQTMQDIERDAKTRVRKNGMDDDRKTNELLWADFVHLTSRPVDGHLPDPHLHAHCFMFNATWDAEEQQVKAGQFRDIKRDMPYYQSRFHKRLSDGLIDLGYEIRRTDKSFEIAGVPQNVLDLFSKRTDEIGRVAKEKGITDIDELGELGARTRSRKQKGHTMAELKADWRRQILELGQDQAGNGQQIIRYAPAKDRPELTPKHCVDHAIQHGFERQSVMQDRRLLADAYRHGIGDKSVGLDTITTAFENDGRLIGVEDGGRMLYTTRDVLAEEQQMVNLARQGQGKLRPLYTKAPELGLEGQQKDAVLHVLTTTNRVSIIRGAAGSGKTTLMKEAVVKIEETGKQVTVVAPTAQASRGVLRDEGFTTAETVAQLLNDPERQQQLQGQVLWVDEAGLLGTKDMNALLKLANEQNARLILGGDTRQHASVVRGDALRILNTVGGIPTAEVSKIYRQRNVDYRQAVESLAKGDMATGFTRLDESGAIEMVDPLKPNEKLVNDYVATIKRGKSALVVSPTHQQSDEVTKAIRETMQEKGLLGKKEIKATRLSNLNLTEAERGDWRNYKEGQVIQFKQNMPGIKRGSLWHVKTSSEKGVDIENDSGQSIPLPLDKSSNFDLFHHSEIALAKGDQIRITRNGFDRDKNRLDNGQMLEVVKVGVDGPIMLRNPVSKAPYSLDPNFGHLAHSYCITSHSSQGKTVDEVFIAQPASTFPATDAKQFYVSVSRGRDRVRIYTDDKEELMNHARRLGDRQSALELVERRVQKDIEHQIRADLGKTNTVKERTKGPAKPAIKSTRVKDRDYEPKL